MKIPLGKIIIGLIATITFLPSFLAETEYSRGKKPDKTVYSPKPLLNNAPMKKPTLKIKIITSPIKLMKI